MVHAKETVSDDENLVSVLQSEKSKKVEPSLYEIRSRNFLKRLSEETLIYVFVKMRPDQGLPFQGYYERTKLKKLFRDLQNFTDTAAGIYYGLNRPQKAAESVTLNCLQVAKTETSLNKSDIARRTALLIDIDPIRPADTSATDDEKKIANKLMQTIKTDLQNQGWPAPVVIDSGNGYHLIFRIDLPGETDLIRNCLKALSLRYNTPESKVDTTVHDAPRIARLPGTHARKGTNSSDRPHRVCQVIELPKELVAVPEKLLLDLAKQSAQVQKSLKESAQPTKKSNHSSTLTLRTRASAYLAAFPPAISGEHGRNRFFHAACILVEKFGLPREDALPILREYNERCIPPFNETDLLNKLDSAIEKVQSKAPGSTPNLNEAVLKRGSTESSKPPFIGWIPDFGWAQTQFIFDRDIGTPPNPADLLIYHLSTQLLYSRPLTPDVLLRQIYMGANFDKNWKKRLKNKVPNWTVSQSTCAQWNCILYGSGIKHQHANLTYQHYGVFEIFCDPNDTTLKKPRSFKLYAPENSAKLKEMREKGILFNVYWPALLLGESPKVGWEWQHRRMLVGIVYELTRERRVKQYDIVGKEIQGNQVACPTNSDHKMTCPFLEPSSRYVVFGGNKRREGLGYTLVGKNFGGWLFKAGFRNLANQNLQERDKSIQTFLSTLADLSEQLGLIPAAIAWGKWKNIYEMLECTKTGNGMDWLKACTLRIFAPHDWRIRWRQFFSDKLGFSWIPTSRDDAGIEGEHQSYISPDTITTALQVQRLIKTQKWTQAELATKISEATGQACSVKRVQRHLSGESKSKAFFDAVEAIRLSCSETPIHL